MQFSKCLVTAVLFCAMTNAWPTPTGPGDIAFIAFNADGDDDFAVVALNEVPAGTTIYFSDREWDGTGLTSGEGTLIWSATDDISPGTVVTFNEVDSASNVNFGVSRGDLARSSSFSLSATNDAIFAFVGSNLNSPTAFLAVIANEIDQYNGTDGTLSGTGLVEGLTAVRIPDSSDLAQYSGARNTESQFANYLPIVGDVSTNWTVIPGGTGDQSDQLLPFDQTPFIPEPTTMSLLITSIFMMRRRSRARSAR